MYEACATIGRRPVGIIRRGESSPRRAILDREGGIGRDGEILWIIHL